jgi:hypothetical protein
MKKRKQRKERTYVCRESKGEKEMTSTPRRYRLGKTRMMFPRGGPCVQCSDLLTDPKERAIFEASPVSGSL